MKICFVTFEYPPYVIGGAAGYAINVMREVRRLGHEVCVVAPAVSMEQAVSDIEDGIRVERVLIKDLPGLRAFAFALKVKKTVLRLEKEIGGFDVLHANGTSDFITARWSRYPRVVTVHHAVSDIQQRSSMKLSLRGITGEENPLGAYMEKRSLSGADMVISVSETTKKFLVRHYGLPEDRVFTVYNGIYAEQYSFKPEDLHPVRAQFAGPDEKLVLCAPARVDQPRKGIVYLLQALSEMRGKDKVKCVITGSGGTEAFREQLAALPRGSVLFPGRLEEGTKRRLFAACDLFVMPSLLEGCPLALLEAMAAGVPIVATNVGGIPELVKQDRNSLLVEARNPEQLAGAMSTLLSDERRSKEMGKNNYDDARRLFLWERAAELTVEVYGKAIELAKKTNG